MLREAVEPVPLALAERQATSRPLPRFFLRLDWDTGLESLDWWALVAGLRLERLARQPRLSGTTSSVDPEPVVRAVQPRISLEAP
jgi:hypothetical protein